MSRNSFSFDINLSLRMRKNFFYPVIAASVLLLLSNASFAQVADSADRKVNLKGGINFRDIGGYRAENGKTVVQGRIYRAAELSRLVQDDLSELERRHITTDIDFRGLAESQKAPDRLWNHVNYIRSGAGSENNANWMASLKNVKDGDSLMTSFYAQTDSLGLRYQPLFEALLKQDPLEALVFHCTAGKDRTGIAASLVLYALGVPETVILADYEASNYYRKDENPLMVNQLVKLGIATTTANDMIQAKKEYLLTTWRRLKEKYGSIDQFLSKELGVGVREREVLQTKYLR